jgi:hypothetical protein
MLIPIPDHQTSLLLGQNQSPLLEQNVPQQTCFQKLANTLIWTAKLPEKGCELAVKQVVHLGQICGLGIRAAKIALVVASSGVLIELGTFAYRQSLAINEGMATLYFVRFLSPFIPIITLNHCLPLSGPVTCEGFCFGCCCKDGRGELVLGQRIRENNEWLPRSVFIMIIVSAIVQPLMVTHATTFRSLSSGEIAEFIGEGIVALTNLSIAAGLSELIKQVHMPLS